LPDSALGLGGGPRRIQAQGACWIVRVIGTNTRKCRGCYSCVRRCPAKAIAARGGKTEIIEDRCIGCGECIKVCGHGAIQLESMLPEVRGYLNEPVETVLALDSCFPAAFPSLSAGQLVAAAKHRGFDRVVEGSFGIDLIAPLYQDLILRDRRATVVSTVSSAAYRYVCHFAPSLVPRLAPIVSPMIAVGRYLKAASDHPIRVIYATAFLGHRMEILDPEVAGVIDAVVTFEELRAMFFRQGIVRDLLVEEPFDEPHPTIGRFYPIAGARSWILGCDPTLSPEEIAVSLNAEESVHALRDLSTTDLFVRFVEACFSERGLDAVFIPKGLSPLARRRLVADYAHAAGGTVEHARRVGKLEPFPGIDLSRGFTARDLRLPTPPDREVLEALARLEKHTDEDLIDCGACGYETCWEGAVALIQGLADENMCLPYLIDKCRRTSLELRRTNRKLAAAQEQLVHSEKLAAMGQLAAGVAHEINNPLGTVLIYAHLLRDQLEEDDPKRQDAETIAQETERCRKIVAGLLNFARQSKLNLSESDIRRLLEDTVREAEAQSPDHGVDVRYEIDADLPRIELDPDQIQQVFLNLIVNAIEAMTRGGTLTLGARTSTDGRTMQVTISDTGTGIAKEDLSRLFTPFFTTKPIGKGTGLGLAIAYGIIKMHRGGIEVHSEVGRGTTFTITLPMKQEIKPEQIVGDEAAGLGTGGEPGGASSDG